MKNRIWLPNTHGLLGDDSGLSRLQKRDALFGIQDGRCGACPAIGRPFHEPGRRGKLVADHCHRTGLLRGLLCWPCNNREGRARWPAIRIYLASPPAGRRWLWDLPDDWCSECTTAVLLRGCTVVDYVTSEGYDEHMDTKLARRRADVIALGRADDWSDA